MNPHDWNFIRLATVSILQDKVIIMCDNIEVDFDLEPVGFGKVFRIFFDLLLGQLSIITVIILTSRVTNDLIAFVDVLAFEDTVVLIW